MKNYKYILSLFIVSTFFLGCDENDLKGVIDESAKPIVTFTASAASGAEIDATEIIISISMDRPVKTSTSFSATQVSGNATLGEDYEIDGGTLPAYATEGEIIISIISDLDPEGDETADFEIVANNIPDIYEVIGTANISLTIEDYVFCAWTLDTVDTFGDSWNGAAIRVTSGGNVIDYANDGDTGTEVQTIIIPITQGDDYTIEFVSGSYDGEVEYTLTDPDGNVFADSYYPAVGVITTGTCN